LDVNNIADSGGQLFGMELVWFGICQGCSEETGITSVPLRGRS